MLEDTLEGLRGTMKLNSLLRQSSIVNNAGTGGTEGAGKVHEMTEETWDFVM